MILRPRIASARVDPDPRSNGQRGFTLIELMIALVLFAFAIAGVLAVAVSLTQGLREQRAAVGAEGAVRVPLDFISDALRQASPGAPTAKIEDTITCTTSALTVTNNFGGNGWDQLDLIYAAGAVVTSTRTVYDGVVTTLDVNDASQLAAGDQLVISNLGQGHLVKVASIAGNTLTLVSGAGAPCSAANLPGSGYNPGSLVIRAIHATFSIGLVDGITTLMMDPDAGGVAPAEPFAEGIEDMQIALGIDNNNDGSVAEVGTAAGDDEWQGNFAGDPAIPYPPGVLRAIRLTLIARTTSGQAGNVQLYKRPAAEDRTAATTNDTFRRRVLRSIVEIRNMGGSP